MWKGAWGSAMATSAMLTNRGPPGSERLTSRGLPGSESAGGWEVAESSLLPPSELLTLTILLLLEMLLTFCFMLLLPRANDLLLPPSCAEISLILLLLLLLPIKLFVLPSKLVFLINFPKSFDIRLLFLSS